MPQVFTLHNSAPYTITSWFGFKNLQHQNLTLQKMHWKDAQSHKSRLVGRVKSYWLSLPFLKTRLHFLQILTQATTSPDSPSHGGSGRLWCCCVLQQHSCLEFSNVPKHQLTEQNARSPSTNPWTGQARLWWNLFLWHVFRASCTPHTSNRNTHCFKGDTKHGCRECKDTQSLWMTHSRFPLHKHAHMPGSTTMLLYACNICARTVQYDKFRTYTPVRAFWYLRKHKRTTTRSSLPKEPSFPIQKRKGCFPENLSVPAWNRRIWKRRW